MIAGLNTLKNDCEPELQLYERLKFDVINGSLTIGHYLVVADLSERYSVSSTPLREALARLSGEQLISSVYGKGYVLPVPDINEQKELYRTMNVLIRNALFEVEDNTTVSSVSFPTALKYAKNIKITKQNQNKLADQLENLLLNLVAIGHNGVILDFLRNILDRTRIVRLFFCSNISNVKFFVDQISEVLKVIVSGNKTQAILLYQQLEVHMLTNVDQAVNTIYRELHTNRH